MKKYRVTVNGTTYEVDVEQVGGEIAKASAPVAQAPETVKPAASASVPATSAPAGNGEKVTAPMPGTILKVNVAPGNNVKKGESLLVLEAMKMENEIVAPCDGTVASVLVSQGASVSTGDVLVAFN